MSDTRRDSALPEQTTSDAAPPPRSPRREGVRTAPRRDVVALLGGLGATALAACVVGSEERPGSSEPVGSAAQALDAGTSNIYWVDNVTDLRAFSGSANYVAILEGYATPGDGGGGVFIWSTTAQTDDGGTILNVNGLNGTATASWVRVFSDALDVRWFGAQGNWNAAMGTGADDTTAIQNAINACSARGGGAVLIPIAQLHCQYKLTSSLTVPAGVWVRGAGATFQYDLAVPPNPLGQLLAVGSFYVFTFTGVSIDANTKVSNSKVSDLSIQASSTQTQGGGFDYTSAGRNIRVEDIVILGGIYCGFNVAPSVSGSTYRIRGIKWDGGFANWAYGVVVGDGTHLVTDVYVERCTATAGTGSSTIWISCNDATDTVVVDGFFAFNGMTGMQVAPSGASSVTGYKLHDVVMDTMTHDGFNFGTVTDLQMHGGGANTCGTGVVGAYGIRVGSGCISVHIVGATVQGCNNSGILLMSGATGTVITGCLLNANNTHNYAGACGIFVAGGTTDFTITENFFRN